MNFGFARCSPDNKPPVSRSRERERRTIFRSYAQSLAFKQAKALGARVLNKKKRSKKKKNTWQFKTIIVFGKVIDN